MAASVAVVGAGVCGLSMAVCILQRDPTVRVTVIADKFSPDTCTDGAAGVILPVTAVKSFELQRSGFMVSVTVLQGRYYLPWLMARFKKLGGVLMKKKLKSLGELLHSYDVIVNCPGLEARELVGDKTVEPLRGQILRVEAPYIKHFYFYDCGELQKRGRACYIYPQIDEVVHGGTKQLGDFNETPTAEDTAHILKVTSEFVPSLKQAKILRTWVGLRPYRPSIRVEMELISTRNGQGDLRTLKVVHNYGHGTTGLTVHWGCAIDSAQLVFDFLKIIPSKL